MADFLTPDAQECCGFNRGEIFIRSLVMAPAFTPLFDIRTGIRTEERLTYMNNLGRVLQSGDGCGWEPASGSTTYGHKTLSMCKVKMYFEQCSDAFECTILGEALGVGNEVHDLSNFQYLETIEELVARALVNDVFDIASFGDTGNASPFLNICDGLWTILEDGVEAGTVAHVDLIEDLTDCDVVNSYFANLAGGKTGNSPATNATSPLELMSVDNSGKAFYVTNSVFQAYIACLESKCCTDMAMSYMVDGRPQYYFRGIPVIPVPRWDIVMSEFSLPYTDAILYIAHGNAVLGFDINGIPVPFMSWYSMDDDLYKFGARFKMGVEYIDPKLVAVSTSPTFAGVGPTP